MYDFAQSSNTFALFATAFAELFFRSNFYGGKIATIIFGRHKKKLQKSYDSGFICPL